MAAVHVATTMMSADAASASGIRRRRHWARVHMVFPHTRHQSAVALSGPGQVRLKSLEREFSAYLASCPGAHTEVMGRDGEGIVAPRGPPARRKVDAQFASQPPARRYGQRQQLSVSAGHLAARSPPYCLPSCRISAQPGRLRVRSNRG